MVEEWKPNVEECLCDQTSSDAWGKDRKLEDKNTAIEPFEAQSSSCARSWWANGTEDAGWLRCEDSRWSSSKRDGGGWNESDGPWSKDCRGQSNGRCSNWDAWTDPKEPCAVKGSGEISAELPSAKAHEIQQQPLTEKSQSRDTVLHRTLHERGYYTARVIDRKPRLPCGRTPPIHRMCLIAGDGKHRELIVLFDEEEGGRIQICSIPENAEAGGPDYILEIKAAEEEATQRFDCLVEKCVGLRMVAQ